MSVESWSVAVDLVASFLKRPARMNHLLERIPESLDPGKRRSAQALLFGTVRHVRLLEKALDEFIKRRPKPRLWAALLVASREVMEEPERSPKIVHHAVERIGREFGRAEKGLANAVLRKVVRRLPELLDTDVGNVDGLSWRYSHPEWLVRRWLNQFGFQQTREFLKWNQQEAGTFARWQRDPAPVPELKSLGEGSNFFRVDSGSWQKISPFVEEGRLYVQNPAAALAPEMLASSVRSGRILDLCAAPGGKGLLLEKLTDSEVEGILSVDLPGPRFERMQENYNRFEAKRLKTMAADILSLQVDEIGFFEGVLLDAPCSNSGVLQHKIDARWRQTPESIKGLLALQFDLLIAASSFVEPGGALVYSTCSVDEEENSGVVARFLDTKKGKHFALEKTKLSLPWRDARDGAGVFLLRKTEV